MSDSMTCPPLIDLQTRANANKRKAAKPIPTSKCGRMFASDGKQAHASKPTQASASKRKLINESKDANASKEARKQASKQAIK